MDYNAIISILDSILNIIGSILTFITIIFALITIRKMDYQFKLNQILDTRILLDKKINNIFIFSRESLALAEDLLDKKITKEEYRYQTSLIPTYLDYFKIYYKRNENLFNSSFKNKPKFKDELDHLTKAINSYQRVRKIMIETRKTVCPSYSEVGELGKYLEKEDINKLKDCFIKIRNEVSN